MAQINFGLDDLRAFVAVADKASFRAAAEALCLSQPALSRRIDKLEDALGARLLERTTRRVTLTNVGRPFLEQARATLDGLDDAVQRLGDSRAARRGLVTVACVPSAVGQLLPRALRQFASAHPQVRVRVMDESAHTVLAAVLAGDADFGLNFIGVQEPDIDFEPIGQESYVLVLPRSHAWAARDHIAWAALAGQTMVGLSRQSGNRLLLDHALASLPEHPVVFYEVNHVTGALSLVEAGLGLATLPNLAVPPDHPTLTTVPLVDPLVSRVLGLITRRDRPLRGVAQTLYDQVREAAALSPP